MAFLEALHQTGEAADRLMAAEAELGEALGECISAEQSGTETKEMVNRLERALNDNIRLGKLVKRRIRILQMFFLHQNN
jgi:hypothetical protein